MENRKYFENKYKEWVEGSINVFPQPSTSDISDLKITNRGRPRKPIEECSDKIKNRKLGELNKDVSTSMISKGLNNRYRTKYDVNKADIVNKVATASPDRVQRIKKSIPTPENAPQKFTPNDALALYLEIGLSKEKYIILRSSLKSKGFHALPSYEKIMNLKRDCC